MKHSLLITTLKFCPYSDFFCYPERLLSVRTFTKIRALGAVDRMIAKNYMRDRPSNCLSRISERSECSDGSHKKLQSIKAEDLFRGLAGQQKHNSFQQDHHVENQSEQEIEEEKKEPACDSNHNQIIISAVRDNF